ncbi:LPXTG cell wall anchor domain-containing protein [Microbacterium sp. YY-03]|uniref:LPXTG cell wall anchor domain-containing protein n=1 Tax=Microbacterium sp. YY-03 TaxID=3421636 RepID=UPI003D179DD8
MAWLNAGSPMRKHRTKIAAITITNNSIRPATDVPVIDTSIHECLMITALDVTAGYGFMWDSGHDSGDAIITIGAANKQPLPATGSPVSPVWMIAGLLALGVGAAIMIGRRREDRVRL